MDTAVFAKMPGEQIISESEFQKIELQHYEPAPVQRELRILLYLGIVLFTTGAAILIYKNIDTMGHGAIVAGIALLCVTAFGICIKYSIGYSHDKIVSLYTWFDYVLLSGCLLLLTLTGYLQFVYHIFGERWGLALFIPMVILFVTAYYFDHLGVLSLAITNLAAWAGISITPLKILKENNFNDARIIYSGLAIGIMLVIVSFMVRYKNIKPHFAFTYKNFGAHLLCISLFAAMCYFNNIYLVWFFVLAVVAFLFYKNALRENSFYFLVIAILYAYTGLSYVVVKLMLGSNFDMIPLYFVIIYFIISGIGLIRIFIHYNKSAKNAGVSQK